MLESLAAAHMRAGKHADARVAYERMLNLRPNSGFAFLGIARADAKAGDKPRAGESLKRFTNSWANADRDLPQVREAGEWK